MSANAHRASVSWVPAILIAGWSIGCVTTGAVEEVPVGPTALELKIVEMAEHRCRVSDALAQGEMATLRSEVEVEGQDTWNMVKAAYAQIPEDPDGAWARLREVTVTPRGSVAAEYWAWLGMAEISLAWGIHEQARMHVEHALELAPGSVPAQALLGRLALATGSRQEGVGLLRQVFEAPDAHLSVPAAAVDLARIELEEGRGEAARAHLEAVIEHYPLRVDALEMLAAVAEADGRLEEAAAHLEKALLAAPARVDIAVRRAEIKQAEGDRRGALDAWRRVSQLRPDEIDAWRRQAALAAELEDAEAEETALEHVFRLDSNDLDTLRRLAGLRMLGQRLVEARDAYTEILLRAPSDRAALLARARMDIASENLREAIGDLRRAALVESESPAEGEAAMAAEAEGLLGEVSKTVGILAQPVTGRSPEAVYSAVSRVVNRVYRQRVESLPALGGNYSVKVIVAGGSVVEAMVVENSLHDPILEALIYWTITDALFPAVEQPREFTLPFILSAG